MGMALNLAPDGRVLSATWPEFAPADAVTVEALPEGNISDYRYADGSFIHDPLPEPEEAEVSTTVSAEELAELQEKAAAYDILTGGAE